MTDLRDRNDVRCSSGRDRNDRNDVSLEAARGLEAADEEPKSIGLAVSSAVAFTSAAASASFMMIIGLTVHLALAPLVTT